MATWARTARLLGRASQLTAEGTGHACRHSDAFTQAPCPSGLQQVRSMASGASHPCSEESYCYSRGVRIRQRQLFHNNFAPFEAC